MEAVMVVAMEAVMEEALSRIPEHRVKKQQEDQQLSLRHHPMKAAMVEEMEAAMVVAMEAVMEEVVRIMEITDVEGIKEMVLEMNVKKEMRRPLHHLLEEEVMKMGNLLERK